jgi:acetoin utilization deacetylase AcuC-like enzyme
MVTVFYSPNYVSSAHDSDTTRKPKWIADSLAESPIPGVQLACPESLEKLQLEQVHGESYIHSIQTGIPRRLAQSQGFSWDAEVWPMVLASNGGVVAAALSALKHGIAGSLSSGLHHARRGRGAGFCTFNGLVIAAKEVLAKGVQSVLILDLDAHCGGGTQSLIIKDRRIWQVDVSVNTLDGYESSDHIWLQVVRDNAQYLPTIRRLLKDIERKTPGFDLCLYNAGMDSHEDCETGGLEGITREILAERERIVFDWCARRELPLAFVLAGGYVGGRLEREGLVRLHRLTLSCAAECGSPMSVR